MKASVPFMVTQKMKADLRAAGYTSEEIAEMKPADAWANLEAADAISDGLSNLGSEHIPKPGWDDQVVASIGRQHRRTIALIAVILAVWLGALVLDVCDGNRQAEKLLNLEIRIDRGAGPR